MTTHNKQVTFSIWKPLIFGASMPIVAKTLHLWLSEATAWAIAGFVLAMLLHLVPPRSPLAFGKVLLLGAATAIFLFGFTKLIG